MFNQTVTNLLFRNLKKYPLHVRLYSSNKYFQIEPSQNKEYVTLKLNKQPVNSFDLLALNELNNSLDKIEQNESLKGVILSSVSFFFPFINYFINHFIFNNDSNQEFNKCFLSWSRYIRNVQAK